MIRIASIIALCGLSACAGISDFRPVVTGVRAPAPVTTPVVAPAPAPAPAPVPQPTILTAKERLLAAIEAQGCVLNAGNVSNVLAAAVITREDLLQLTPQLQSEGRVEVAGSGGIRSTSANCINA